MLLSMIWKSTLINPYCSPLFGKAWHLVDFNVWFNTVRKCVETVVFKNYTAPLLFLKRPIWKSVQFWKKGFSRKHRTSASQQYFPLVVAKQTFLLTCSCLQNLWFWATILKEFVFHLSPFYYKGLVIDYCPHLLGCQQNVGFCWICSYHLSKQGVIQG